MDITPDFSEPSKERIRCNICKYMTWHQLLHTHSGALPVLSDDDEVVDEVSEIWELFQCLGCGRLVARVARNYPWEDQIDYQFYPERTSSHHQKKSYQKLPTNLENLYSEVVAAYNKNSHLLCTAGLRALIEGLCENQGIKEGPNQHGKVSNSLEGKINGLASIVPANIVKNLHGLRFLGNQALHELEVPSASDLELALNVVEDILNVVYDLNYKAQLLYEKATRPKATPIDESEISF